MDSGDAKIALWKPRRGSHTDAATQEAQAVPEIQGRARRLPLQDVQDVVPLVRGRPLTSLRDKTPRGFVETQDEPRDVCDESLALREALGGEMRGRSYRVLATGRAAHHQDLWQMWTNKPCHRVERGVLVQRL